MHNYYDSSIFRQPDNRAMLSGEAFFETYPEIATYKVGDPILIRDKTYTVDGSREFAVTPGGVYQVLQISRVLEKGEEAQYGARDRKKHEMVHLAHIATFGNEPTEDDKVRREHSILKERVRMSSEVLDSRQPIINPNTFEPFGENDPELLHYYDKVVENREKNLTKIADLEARYPWLTD